ncbi:MAG: GNAT family N-acetyltransferase [Alphaproteobacteria bacterium]|nr:GNAT family N-acetyltransferase [Alphaproteobacteria bacterium]
MSALPGPQLKFVGPGTLEVTVTYLEMKARPNLPQPLPPSVAYRIDRVERPSVAFYRYLYNTVGEPWLWHERRRASDAELAEILGDANLWLYVMYAEGEPAGYAELDARRLPEVELAYFGIVPKFIGRRLGPTLLHAAVEMAWQAPTRRFWVHTCTLDHPKALPCYIKAGFVPYKDAVRRIRDPRPLPLNI